MKVQIQHGSAALSVVLEPYIVEWQGIPSRFFAIIHDALADEIRLTPSNFNSEVSNNLGESCVRFTVLGTSNSISLYSDRLTFDFPYIQPRDFDWCKNIVDRVFASCRRSLSQHKFVTIEALGSVHASIAENCRVSDYLDGFALESVRASLDSNSQIHNPGAKFGFQDRKGVWTARCIMKKSETVPNAVFVHFSLTINKINSGDNYLQTFNKLLGDVTNRCLTGLELEISNEQ